MTGRWRWTSAALLVLTGCGGSPLIQEGRAPVSGGDFLAYRLVGSGPDTLVFLHGGPAVGSRYLEASFGSLARRHTLLFYDQRGRGLSVPAHRPDSLSLAQDVEDLESLRASLHLGRLKLVGHNWGAGLAFEYARRHPAEVERMVLLSPMLVRMEYSYYLQRTITTDQSKDSGYSSALGTGRDSTDPAGFCRDYWGWEFGPWRPLSPRVTRQLASSVCNESPDQLRTRRALRPQILRSLGAWNWEDGRDSVATPRLIVIGSGDDALVEVARHWAGTSSSQLLIAGQSPHFPWIEAPDQINSAIEEFLVRRQWPAGSAQISAVSLR